EVGGSRVIRSADDDDVTIVGTGITVHEALKAADALEDEGISARVIDAYSIKPIDAETLLAAAEATGKIVTVEDHFPEGGLGDAVLAALAGLDHPAERRRRRRLPEPLEHDDGSAAERGLLDAGCRDGPAECVRHDLNPIGVLEERAARRDDLVDARHQGGDLGEAEGDALEPGLTQVERRRVERQPMDRPL